MAQVKIFGLRSHIAPLRKPISEAVHDAIVEAYALPPQKRFHRFILLDAEDFLFPSDRSERYTIVEVSAFTGRSPEAKRSLISLIYANFISRLGYDPSDLEITLFETPREHWGIRGRPADELELNYEVKV